MKKKLLERRAKLEAELKVIFDKEEPTTEDLQRAKELDAEIEGVQDSIRVAERAEERARVDAESRGTVAAGKELEAQTRGAVEVGKDREAEKPFKNLGEQLRAIYQAATDRTRPVDKRLMAANERARGTGETRAALGMNEGVGSEGGFALQEDFAGAIFETAVQTGDILSRVDGYPVSSNSNCARWIEVEETDVSTTVFGGVQVYWAAEATAVTASKPKIVERKLELEKLFGLGYATGEMLEDTAFVTALFGKAFSTAITRKLEIDIVNGTGVGCPLGILSSDALVEVAKENGQGADTVMYENIVKAWTRMLPKYRSQAVWLVHPDTEEQLEFMKFPVGTGGVPVFLPAGGASESPFSVLKGRPVIPSDACAALGDPGDILFAALGEYMLINKGTTRMDTSIHVQFTTDQQAFRFIYRANGKPKLASALTIRNSSVQRSAFVAIAARA